MKLNRLTNSWKLIKESEIADAARVIGKFKEVNEIEQSQAADEVMEIDELFYQLDENEETYVSPIVARTRNAEIKGNKQMEIIVSIAKQLDTHFNWNELHFPFMTHH